MLILILTYIGGIITIFSPCILPVIPFIFSRSDQPFLKSGLPMLIGMAISFTVFALLSVVGGSWIIQVNLYGRIIALVIFAMLGFSFLVPSFAEFLAQPLVKIGNNIQNSAQQQAGICTPLLIGISLGLLWTPCAGPILGLVLAGAALNGPNSQTFILLLAFAMGAATSLAIAISASSKVLHILKKNLGTEIWIKRILGLIVLCTVAIIALGLDIKFLAKFSYVNTNKIEQTLVDKVSSNTLQQQGHDIPSINGAVKWFNSKPLTLEQLKNKVVVIDFWTYSCINCLRTLPYLKSWAEKYQDSGLIIVGVHTPEFSFEKDLPNVEHAIRDLKITYPVAVDNNRTIWTSFKNVYWPAHYFIDKQGIIRYHHFGEGNYDKSEKIIQQLLLENTKSSENNNLKSKKINNSIINGAGVEASSGKTGIIGSPETYLGYARQTNFISTPIINRDKIQNYQSPSDLKLNQWSLTGAWNIGPENAVLHSATGTLSFRFLARDLHLVMGSIDNKKVKFKITIDGKPPMADHGQDVNQEGEGLVTEFRLYQLIRQQQNRKEHVFSIEFLDTNVSVFAFTFG